jgi:hypothetical protein
MSKPKNFHTIRYGNKEAEIKFGHLNTDGTKSAFLIRSGLDHRHYISLDSEGPRKGRTLHRNPETCHIKCGDDVKGDNPAFIVEALNGDIILLARNGNIRMEAHNVLIKADGYDNKSGNVDIEANERVNIRAKEVNLEGKQACRFITSGIGEITCKTALNIQASACSAASAVSKNNPTKFGLNADKLMEE